MKFIIETRKIFPILFLLMLTSALTFAQNEIPEKIKGKITEGINALETSKSQEDVEKAVKEFSDAIAIAPEYPDAHYYLGKTLSMMQGSAAKAVKEYLKYLEMYPDAPDKAMLYEEIGKMKQVISEKRKSSLSGVEFINTSDGIYVRYVYPFSPANKQFKVGDKIRSIGGKEISPKTSLYYFLKSADDYPSDDVPVTIIRGGKEQNILMNKTAKTSDKNIKELGEEDLNDIISTFDKPVVVVFWTSWSAPCIKYAPFLRELANDYGNTISFVSVSLDENINIEKEYEVVNIPDTRFYKNGKFFGKILGFSSDSKDKRKEKVSTFNQINEPFGDKQNQTEPKVSNQGTGNFTNVEIKFPDNTTLHDMGFGWYAFKEGVKVAMPFPNSTAEKLGLLKDDMIVKVNDTSTENLSQKEFKEIIKNNKSVTLHIKRPVK